MIEGNRSILIILLASGAFLVPLYLAMSGQVPEGQQNRTSEKKSSDDSVKALKATFPVVDYTYEVTTDPARKARGKKFGKFKVIDPNLTDNSTEAAILHWETGLPALPVEKSQIIVIGTVTEANAFLSENKRSVYSEFKIKIENVFKNDSFREYTTGGNILAEREGGIVRYPTGFETWYFVEGQQMPSIGKQYLFFLTFDFPGADAQKDDLNILTAYELVGTRVVPLDNPGGGTHPIARYYKGKDIAILLNDLRELLTKTPTSKHTDEAQP